MLFKKLREVGQHFHGRGTEMVFDAFDVLALGFGIQAKQRKKSRKGGVPVLNSPRDFPALVRQHEAAIFFVFQVASFGQLLNHAGHGGLLDLEGRGDVHHAGIALFLNELMDALQIILGALTGRKLRHVACGLNTVLQTSQEM